MNFAHSSVIVIPIFDQMEEALGALGITVHWVEDWDYYHAAMGEVHCGSNAMRQIPQVKWWEVAL
jgi:protein-arginine deiminase